MDAEKSIASFLSGEMVLQAVISSISIEKNKIVVGFSYIGECKSVNDILI